MSPMRSARCSPSRVSWARCRQPCATACGAPRRRGTRPPVRREAWPRWQRWPTCEAGRYDTALVLGVELEKTVPRRHRGASSRRRGLDSGTKGQDAKYHVAVHVRQLADEYDRRYGLDETHLHAIAELNFAQRTPQPATRRPENGRSPDQLRRRRREQPARRRPAAPQRLQPDHRRRRRESSWSPTDTSAIIRTLGRSRRIARLGAPHRRPGPAAEARPRGDDPYVMPHVRRGRRSMRCDAHRSTLDDVRRHRDPRLLTPMSNTWRSTTSA